MFRHQTKTTLKQANTWDWAIGLLWEGKSPQEVHAVTGVSIHTLKYWQCDIGYPCGGTRGPSKFAPPSESDPVDYRSVDPSDPPGRDPLPHEDGYDCWRELTEAVLHVGTGYSVSPTFRDFGDRTSPIFLRRVMSWRRK